MLSPMKYTTDAVTICPISFFLAPSGLKSSHNPSPYIMMLPTSSGAQSTDGFGSVHQLIVIPASKDRTIGNPPSRETGTSCRLRVSLGSSNPMPRRDTLNIQGMKKTETIQPRTKNQQARIMASGGEVSAWANVRLARVIPAIKGAVWVDLRRVIVYLPSG